MFPIKAIGFSFLFFYQKIELNLPKIEKYLRKKKTDSDLKKKF
jgi:hypothetical protein